MRFRLVPFPTPWPKTFHFDKLTDRRRRGQETDFKAALSLNQFAQSISAALGSSSSAPFDFLDEKKKFLEQKLSPSDIHNSICKWQCVPH